VPQPNDYAPGAAPAPTAQPALDPYAAQVAKWKHQHREVTEITVTLQDGSEASCFIHNPDRNVIAFALTKVMNKQLLEAGEFLLMNCWLGGDEQCNPNNPKAYDPAVVAACLQAAQTVELLAASSKKR
jgi:hypothetical protein